MNVIRTPWLRHLLIAGLLAFSAAGPARAHEGHDQPAPVATGTDPSLVVRTVANESMELVVKYHSSPSAKPAHLQIYVSDFTTNTPINGARLALRTTAPAQLSTTATQLRPGIYEAHLDFPQPGEYTLILAVTGPVSGEFAMQKFELGLSLVAAASTEKKSSGPSRVMLMLVGIGVVLLGLVCWVVLRRRRAVRVKPAAVAVLLLASMLPVLRTDASAHEGHDAGPATTAGGTGPRYVAKESQFLLGILTVPLRLEQLRSQFSAVGHVVPGTGAWTTIAAPQSGRFEGVGRPLAVGDRVKRGQLLGYLQIIDRLPVRAPIGGLVAEVDATPGQSVQAGQPLFRVLDPAHLRVEVPLFGENLTRGLAARTATVHLSAIPDRFFAARVRGLAPTVSSQAPDQNEPGGGPAAASPIPPLLLDVTNTGGLLRPGMLVEVSLETAMSQAIMAVPQSAIVYQETGPGVFVHTGPELFEFRPVAVGAKYIDRVGVSGELKPGDRIVRQGAYSIVAAPPASSAAAGTAK